LPDITIYCSEYSLKEVYNPYTFLNDFDKIWRSGSKTN